MRPIFFLREAFRSMSRNAIPSFAAVASIIALHSSDWARRVFARRVLPKALSAAGFEFTQPTLEGALREELRTGEQ